MSLVVLSVSVEKRALMSASESLSSPSEPSEALTSSLGLCFPALSVVLIVYVAGIKTLQKLVQSEQRVRNRSERLVNVFNHTEDGILVDSR